MRSKSSRVESPTNRVLLGVPQATHDITQEEEGSLPIKSLKVKVQLDDKEQEEKVTSDQNVKSGHLDSSGTSSDQRVCFMDLSKEDLLKLLGIMEAEVQVSLQFDHSNNI